MTSCRRTASLTLFLVLVAGLIPSAGHSESRAIHLDGLFDDWSGSVDHTDPAGDGGGGVDFREIDIANDDEYLFVRFQTTTDVGIQESFSNVVLFIDTDMNAATGYPVSGIGAELRWFFGARYGCFYPSGSCVTILQSAIQLRMAPSVTSNTFEIALGRYARPDGTRLLFPNSTFRVALYDNASVDYAPNYAGLTYTFDSTPVPPSDPIPFGRRDPQDVRVVTWNVRDLASGSSFDPAVTPAADRVLSAIDPDIICFQEIYTPSASQTRTLVETMLPGGAPWQAAKQNDCIVVSRFPILQSWGLDGNLAVLLDADLALDSDLLLVCAHLPCCTNDAGRQREIDRIMSFLRDAMTSGGVVTVPPGTGVLIAGDMNLVGLAQQLTSFLEGDIVDEAVFGPDFDPDWDGTGLTDLVSCQTEQRFAYTWREDETSFAPGRLDFLIYNDSVLSPRHSYIVYSPEMSQDAIVATGIQPADVPTVTDHLPHVADFRSLTDVSAVDEPTDGARGLAFTAPSSLGRDGIRSALVLGVESLVTVEVFDVNGRLVRSLSEAERIGPGYHDLAWDGESSTGNAAPGGVYFARVTARPVTGGPDRSATARWILLR